jgi:hypothetical protein
MGKLSERILSYNHEILNPSIEFKRFILDHLLEIKKNSKVVLIEDHEMYRYKNYLSGFLKHKNIRIYLENIIMLINNISDSSEFDNFKYIYVPNEQYIEELLTRF